MNYPDTNIESVVLEKLKIGAEIALSPYLLDVHVVVECLAMKVRGFIWSEQHQHIEIKYPRDWWQAFKERWFSKRMLERWPVEYKMHNIDVKTLYPNYRPSIPDQEYRIRLFCEEQ